MTKGNMIKNMPQHELRNHLSEQVRVAELAWAKAEDRASRYAEGKSIMMAEMKLTMVEQGLAKSLTAAEDKVRASDAWKSYVKKMHDAEHEANNLKAEWRDMERKYWASVSSEASERQQMRMSR